MPAIGSYVVIVATARTKNLLQLLVAVSGRQGALGRGVMQAFLLIATQLLPELIQISGRDQSGRAKEKIVGAIKNATGGDDPMDAQRKVDDDTKVRAELLKRLTTVALEEAIDQSRDREAARSMQEAMERGGRVTASLTIPTKGGDFPSLELQTMFCLSGILLFSA
jgi:hypothetical protein